MCCSYREFYYNAEPLARLLVADMRNTSHRLQMKQHMRCKPFQHFVDRFRDIFVVKGLLPVTAACPLGFKPSERRTGRVQNNDGSWREVTFGGWNCLPGGSVMSGGE